MSPTLDQERIFEIARTTHEVNRAYCVGLGDHSQVSWEDAPAWQRDSAIAGVTAVVNGNVKTPKEQHETWMLHKVREGWTHGPDKDPEAKTHPCLVAYIDLPIEQRAKDHLFQHVVIGLIAGTRND